MQKFTRALTREVEVGGERLAITFDATGLSVRLVGSRREPHRLTWAEVGCAGAGLAPDQLSGALAALRAGAPKAKAATDEAPPAAPALLRSPAEKAAAAPPDRLADVLPRLDAWLVHHRPTYHAALNP